jgi:hypothetical protein
MTDNFDPNFLYGIITIIDTRPSYGICVPQPSYGSCLAAYRVFSLMRPVPTLDICATAQVQHFAIMVKHLIMSLSIEVWVRLPN